LFIYLAFLIKWTPTCKGVEWALSSLKPLKQFAIA